MSLKLRILFFRHNQGWTVKGNYFLTSLTQQLPKFWGGEGKQSSQGWQGWPQEHPLGQAVSKGAELVGDHTL